MQSSPVLASHIRYLKTFMPLVELLLLANLVSFIFYSNICAQCDNGNWSRLVKFQRLCEHHRSDVFCFVLLFTPAQWQVAMKIAKISLTLVSLQRRQLSELASFYNYIWSKTNQSCLSVLSKATNKHEDLDNIKPSEVTTNKKTGSATGKLCNQLQNKHTGDYWCDVHARKQSP